jgi:hypothetical protein
MTGVRPAEFLVTGHWRDEEAPSRSGSTPNLTAGVVSAFVTFRPRVPRGFTAYVNNYDVNGDGSVVEDTGLILPGVEARILTGRLSTINAADTPGVHLLSADPVLHLAELGIPDGDLYYDIDFTQVQYARLTGQPLRNFAIKAPPDTTPVSLTSSSTVRYPFVPTTSHPYID